MIVRWVSLPLRPDSSTAFERLYRASAPRVRQRPGCLAVYLLRHPDDEDTYVTLSLWQDAASLETYRESNVFGEIWPQVKALLRAPASARSYEVVD
jgi:quinol monooxygenase YgiN